MPQSCLFLLALQLHRFRTSQMYLNYQCSQSGTVFCIQTMVKYTYCIHVFANKQLQSQTCVESSNITCRSTWFFGFSRLCRLRNPLLVNI